ncbi:hypothetical protein ACFQ4Z_12465 [Oceanobacillus oncorhynchi subsp. oncorhynchi]|uniref:hypothetical protein n=1 Tax=Oceanobacillus TaxID=182709 RepID=UPI0030DA54C5
MGGNKKIPAWFKADILFSVLKVFVLFLLAILILSTNIAIGSVYLFVAVFSILSLAHLITIYKTAGKMRIPLIIEMLLIPSLFVLIIFLF